MKFTKLIVCLLIACSFLMISACGGGGGDSSGSGEVTMSITDAKPLLPEGADQATNLKVTFTEVRVHKSEGGWISLPLTGDLPSNTIDLLQFTDGKTTEIVPPVLLDYGKYTQIRIEVSKAEISFDGGTSWDPVEIPPEHLKTDKNFMFDVDQPAAADIVIDFDLSRSLVVTDPYGTPSYKLKPVLHIVRAEEAATLSGNIDNESFVDDLNARVTVLVSNPESPGAYEEYTMVEVPKSDSTPTTDFSIFWLVPNKSYRVEIDFDGDRSADWCQNVAAGDLQSGAEVILNITPPLVCSS